MKVIPVEKLSNGYRNLFLSELKTKIKPIVCPEGFERVLLGKNLKVSCCRSIKPYPKSEELSHIWFDNFHSLLSPIEYGIEDLDEVIQQQNDGHVLYGWF